MMLFIGNLSELTTKEDLIGLIYPELNRSFFSKLFGCSRALLDIALVNLLNLEQSMLDTHAIVTLDHKVVAQRLIHRLDGKMVKGKTICVREYKNRSPKNDRRKNFSGAVNANIDLRKGERRDRMQLVNYLEHIEI